MQTSQLGYHPAQPKLAVIELDKGINLQVKAELYSVTPRRKAGKENRPEELGGISPLQLFKSRFQRYKEEGLYLIRYGASVSSVFELPKISTTEECGSLYWSIFTCPDVSYASE